MTRHQRVDQEEFQIMRGVYNWSQQKADLVRFGTGSASGSYTFLYDKQGTSGSVFSVYSTGSLSINFGYMAKIYTQNTIDAFRERLAAIPSLEKAKDAKQYYVFVEIKEAFSNPDYLERFKQAVLELKDQE